MFEKIKFSGISYYTCDDLTRKTQLFLYNSINEKYIKNLKYLKNDIEIDFYYDDYENIFKCINSLNNKYKKIKIRVNNKMKFNEAISKNNLKTLDLNKIEIDQSMVITTLEDYICYENILYKMVEPAVNLSPLEKYIYAYNIVKSYKEYKECKKNKIYARQLYRVLFNNYIVCVGFSAFLSDLLSKLNINNKRLSVMVDSDEIKNMYQINHERLYVYLKDEKYKINGYYLSDPTWDNNLKFDLYTFMLITNSKNDLAKKIQYDDKFIIFNINSLDDFYIKCNELKERFGLSNSDVLTYILNFIEELEPDIYNSLIDIHNKNKKDINLTLEEIGKHLIKRVNKNINQKKIWKGVRVVYNNSYGYKNICAMNDDLKKVINYNNIRRKNHFYSNSKQKVLKKIKYEEGCFF